jgi:hypothetical protein
VVSFAAFRSALDRIRGRYAEDGDYRATLPALSNELGLSMALCAAAAAVLVSNHELRWEHNVLMRSDSTPASIRRRTA